MRQVRETSKASIFPSLLCLGRPAKNGVGGLETWQGTKLNDDVGDRTFILKGHSGTWTASAGTDGRLLDFPPSQQLLQPLCTSCTRCVEAALSRPRHCCGPGWSHLLQLRLPAKFRRHGKVQHTEATSKQCLASEC